MSYFGETRWKKSTFFTGRNGTFKCNGISVFESAEEGAILEPVTSKGGIGRCAIKVPNEAIPAVIEHLQKCYKEPESAQ